MKKFLLLVVATVFAVSSHAQLASKSTASKAQSKMTVSAQQVKVAKQVIAGSKNIALAPVGEFKKFEGLNNNRVENIPMLPATVDGKKMVVAKDVLNAARSARKLSSQKEGSVNLLPSYTGSAMDYFDQVPMDSWTVTPGTYEYEGETYDCINEIIPTTPLIGETLDFDYITSGNLIGIVPFPYLTVGNTGYYAVPLDYTKYNSTGNGMIILQVEADGSLHLPTGYENHLIGWAKCKVDAEYNVTEISGFFILGSGYKYEAAGSDPFVVSATYTGTGKDYFDSSSLKWDMQLGKVSQDGVEIDVIRNLIPRLGTDNIDVPVEVAENTITIKPQNVGTHNGYYMLLRNVSGDGTIVITKDEKGHLSLPEGTQIGIRACEDEECTDEESGWFEIVNNVTYYAPDQPIPNPAPEVLIDATSTGMLFANMGPSGYSYSANLGLLPAYTDYTVNNYTTDVNTAWEWGASLMDNDSEGAKETYSGKEFNFTFPLKQGQYSNIWAKGWNGEAVSDPAVLGTGSNVEQPYTNAYFYSGTNQDFFEFSDGTHAIMTANNPANIVKFYTNWATPDIYTTSIATIYSYGFKPTKPLYIEGLEIPVVGFTSKEDFSLTFKIVKASRSNGRLVIGDVIAQAVITNENVDDTYEEKSGLTMLNVDNFYVEDEDGMTVDVDHLFLDEEFAIVIEGWDNGTFSGVLGSQEDSFGFPTTTWFDRTGSKEGEMRSYSGGWPTLFIGYAGATYGYLNTTDDTDITIPAEGGKATLSIEPMLCSFDETTQQRSTRLFEDEELARPAWLEIAVENEVYTSEKYGFDLVVSADAIPAGEEGRSATVRLYQEGAYIDLVVTQGASAGITTTTTVVKTNKAAKFIKDNKVAVTKDGKIFTVAGARMN